MKLISDIGLIFHFATSLPHIAAVKIMENRARYANLSCLKGREDENLKIDNY